MNTIIKSIEEWVSLPELPIARISAPQERGSVYAVSKVGMVIVDVIDCLRIGITDVKPLHGNQTALPIVTVNIDGESKLYRLPVLLGSWAFDMCAFAHQGTNLLPEQVEFSDLNGRITAEMN